MWWLTLDTVGSVLSTNPLKVFSYLWELNKVTLCISKNVSLFKSWDGTVIPMYLHIFRCSDLSGAAVQGRGQRMAASGNSCHSIVSVLHLLPLPILGITCAADFPPFIWRTLMKVEKNDMLAFENDQLSIKLKPGLLQWLDRIEWIFLTVVNINFGFGLSCNALSFPSFNFGQEIQTPIFLFIIE